MKTRDLSFHIAAFKNSARTPNPSRKSALPKWIKYRRFNMSLPTPSRFFVETLQPSTPAATAIDRYNHTAAFRYPRSPRQHLQLSLSPLLFTKLRVVDIIDHIQLNYGILSRHVISSLDIRMSMFS